MREGRIRWGVVAVVAAAPLSIGGAHAITQVLLSAAMLALAAAHVYARARHGTRWIDLAAPIALGVAAMLLQLVPLPASLVGLLSPHARELRVDAGAASAFLPLTLDVPATVLALCRAFAALGLLLLAAGLANGQRRARRFLVALAALGGAMTVLTVVQKLVGAEAILGLYHLRSAPEAGFTGTFVDPNHAASLFALSSLIALGLGIESTQGRRFLWLTVAAACAVAVIGTASRAGALGLAVGAAVFGVVLFVRSWGKLAGALTAAALLVVASTATLWISDGLRLRLTPPSVEQLWSNQKTRGWRDTATMIRDYTWTGVGRGAFEAPLTAYRDDDEHVRLVYPENALLQRASELGVPVALAMLVLIAFGLPRVWGRIGRLEPSLLGAGAGVLAVFVHELADFGLEMPGVAFPTLLALGVLVRRVDEREEARHSLPRRSVSTPVAAGALAVWAAALLAAVWALPRTLDAEFAALQQKAKQKQLDGAELAAAIARHPASDHLELFAAEGALARRDFPSAMRHLNRALLLHPANAQAHQLAARTLVAVGRRSQAALEYRLAVANGMSAPYGELLRLVPDHLLDAVPQRARDLLDLARELVKVHRPDLADAACQRALSVDASAAPALLRERVEIARLGGVPKIVAAAAAALVEGEPATGSYTLAATVLDQVGDARGADDLIARGLKEHPFDGALVLLGARLRMNHGDLDGARARLKRNVDPNGAFSLADRRQAEELLAQIADRAGDVEEAVLARARARLLAHKMTEPLAAQ
jgi:tetratricopeptide (TPR) repeat protein